MWLTVLMAAAKFTPTQKDDAALRVLQKFFDDNPDLGISMFELGAKFLENGMNFKDDKFIKEFVGLFFSVVRRQNTEK